ncbi:thioredoxin-like protein AAED1, chloroplastic isoform X1 [Alnus glutinosa]|uniref:thioredoxin-like protein AAED1, chloroplastic isoform X1 n=1 Tax=Alnus glutinosa TaxID=3517 RepID=UPI002D79A677|nr:thioredoxin-like protein AAED1, chloroplastic isoform X1 [Alnus glutinosa]
MATSLSTLSTNNIRSNRITNPYSTRVLPNRALSLSRSPKHSKKTASLSPRQSHVIVPSAISGSSGIETSAVSEDTTSLLDTVKVLDLNGNAIPISDLWKDRRSVVAFARHFGCVLCRKRADYLASKQDIMDKSGVALVLIGPGSIDQARAFTEQTKFKGEVYADPSHSSYEALKFVSGVSTTFTPKAGLKIIQLYMEGYRQDWKLSFERDTVNRGGWQQGGIIVAGPGKSNISYVHKDKEAGDDPDIEDILKACCS